MLLIRAVQAVSMSGLPIFRHRARRGNLMTTCAFLSRASHAHASLAQQRCRSPDSVPWSSPWAPPRRWTSRWTTSSRRRVRVRRVSVPRIVVVASSRGPVLSRRAFRSDRILTYVRHPPRLSFAALQGKKEQRAAKKKALVRSRRVPCLRVARFDRVARRVRPRARENSVHSFNSSGERIIPRCYAFDRTIP
jgi:hypothetical protein